MPYPAPGKLVVFALMGAGPAWRCTGGQVGSRDEPCKRATNALQGTGLRARPVLI